MAQGMEGGGGRAGGAWARLVKCFNDLMKFEPDEIDIF